jgi:hypothetical protein
MGKQGVKRNWIAGFQIMAMEEALAKLQKYIEKQTPGD